MTSTHFIAWTPSPGRLAPVVLRGAMRFTALRSFRRTDPCVDLRGVLFPRDDGERSPASDASVTAPIDGSIAFAEELALDEAETACSVSLVKEARLRRSEATSIDSSFTERTLARSRSLR